MKHVVTRFKDLTVALQEPEPVIKMVLNRSQEGRLYSLVECFLGRYWRTGYCVQPSTLNARVSDLRHKPVQLFSRTPTGSTLNGNQHPA
jgi:hypothetical protein